MISGPQRTNRTTRAFVVVAALGALTGCAAGEDLSAAPEQPRNPTDQVQIEDRAQALGDHRPQASSDRTVKGAGP